MQLQDYGFSDTKEGTIYPLLMRLEKKEIISSKYRKSPLGPKQKYYFLTKNGEKYLKEFTVAWNDLKKSVKGIIYISYKNIKRNLRR